MAEKEPTKGYSMPMSAYPRGPFFQRKFNSFVERSTRVIQTEHSFQLTKANRDLLNCCEIEVRVTGNLRYRLTNTQLAARPEQEGPTTCTADQSEYHQERPLIYVHVLAIHIRFETIGQLKDDLEKEIGQFNNFTYDIIYIEVGLDDYTDDKGNANTTVEYVPAERNDVQRSVNEVIRSVFRDLDIDHQLVLLIVPYTGIYHTRSTTIEIEGSKNIGRKSAAKGTYQQEQIDVHASYKTRTRSQTAAMIPVVAHEAYEGEPDIVVKDPSGHNIPSEPPTPIFPHDSMPTRISPRKHARPASSESISSRSTKYGTKLQRLDSADDNDLTLSPMDISPEEADTPCETGPSRRSLETSPTRRLTENIERRQGHDISDSANRSWRTSHVEELTSSDSEHSMGTSSEEEGIQLNIHAQDKKKRLLPRQEHGPRHKYRLRSQTKKSTEMHISTDSVQATSSPKQSQAVTMPVLRSQTQKQHLEQQSRSSETLPSDISEKHEERSRKHHSQPQQQQQQQRTIPSESPSFVLVSELNLGRAISFQIEHRMFLALETVDDALRDAKRVLDGRQTAGSPQLTVVDKLLYEIRGLYNQGISNLCQQKRSNYRPIPRELMNAVLEMEHVVGCGRIYGRFTVHIPDDVNKEKIDTDRLRTNIQKAFDEHQFGTDEHIVIQKMIRNVERLCLNAA